MSENQQSNKRRRLERVIARNNKKSTFRVTHLPDDLLRRCLSFVGPGNYRFVAGACRRFRELYPFPKETWWVSAAASVARAKLCHEDFVTTDGSGRDVPLEYMKCISHRAASIGQTKVIEWTYEEHSCELGWKDFVVACAGGHLNVLEWCDAKNEIYWDYVEVRAAAAENGHLRVLEWIYQRTQSFCWFAYFAAVSGQVHVLQWMKEQGWRRMPNEPNPLCAAARNGHLHVLTWLKDNGFADMYYAVKGAAKGGRLDVLLWCRDQGCEWNETTCAQAAEGGQLDTLKWLRVHGVPWNSATIFRANFMGHSQVAQWARANGCPEPVELVEFD